MRREPIEGPAAWRGAEVADRDDWIRPLSTEQVASLDAAVAHAAATGKDRTALTRADFPLGALAPAVAAWMAELEHGRGFLLVRGVPVERYDRRQAELAYWGLGLHMGTAVSQNSAGDRLGHVRDTGADPSDPNVRLYRTRVDLGFHTDGADVIGLLCLQPARRGGASRIVSSVSIYNEILRDRPDLVPLLYQPFPFHAYGQLPEGAPPYFELPLCRFENERLTTFYIGWYIRESQQHAEAPRLTVAQRELLDRIDALAADPALHLDMDFRPGDIQWLKNAVTLHARTEYEDHDDPARKRHLLRLWLTPHGRWVDGDDFLRQGIPVRGEASPDARALADR